MTDLLSEETQRLLFETPPQMRRIRSRLEHCKPDEDGIFHVQSEWWYAQDTQWLIEKLWEARRG